MFTYIRSFLLIFLCLYIGKGIVWITHIPISASIIGMLLLFILLALHLIPGAWIKDGSELFIKHMTLFFVPVSVGLMDHFDILQTQAASLLVGTLGSSLIVFVVIGKLNQILATHYEKKQKDKELL